jgi:hypothetical protein
MDGKYSNRKEIPQLLSSDKIINNSISLLSVNDVAIILNISARTVYEHADELGGFYPAGIKVLRFNPEVIYGYLEGQNTEGLAIRFPIQRKEIRQRRTSKQAGGNIGKGRQKKGSPANTETTEDRHGLFRYSKRIP